MIATAILRQRGTIEPYLGEGARGPRYGPPVRNVKLRIVGKRRSVRTREGTDVIADAVAEVRPEVSVPDLSRLTVGTSTYTVLTVATSQDLGGSHHHELILEGPR